MTRLRVLACLFLLTAAAGAQTVRIGVFGLFHPRTLTILPSGTPLVMEIAGRSVSLDRGAAQVRLSGRSFDVTTGYAAWRTQRLLLHARDGGSARFTLAVAGKIRRTFLGTLELIVRKEGLLPIVVMDREVAVASVVAAESSPRAPLEALKAQAVAVRSFIVARASGHRGFDFCDTTHCQVLRQPPPDGSPSAQAARATRGLVLAWRDNVFAAMYTPACGGRTRSLAELDLPLRDYPYFSVECPYCRTHPHPWTRDLSRPVRGERDRLRYVRRQGWSALPGNNYQVRETAGVLVAEGSGRGHGLGLCERGASAMAAEGKTFRQILEHYYPNTTILTQPASHEEPGTESRELLPVGRWPAGR